MYNPASPARLTHSGGRIIGSCRPKRLAALPSPTALGQASEFSLRQTLICRALRGQIPLVPHRQTYRVNNGEAALRELVVRT